VLEYHASIQRIKDLCATDVPNAALLLGRIVDSIEAYLRVQPPSGTGLNPDSAAGRASPAMESIAMTAIEEEAARVDAPPRPEKSAATAAELAPNDPL
jgi:hypothetical protein